MPSTGAAPASPVVQRYRRLLGANVTRIREGLEWSQRDLAAATKVSPDWICLIEQGKVNPTLDVIVELALALKVRPADLLLPERAEK